MAGSSSKEGQDAGARGLPARHRSGWGQVGLQYLQDPPSGDHGKAYIMGKRCAPFVPSSIDVDAKAHWSHHLASTGGLIWCTHCGAYASKTPKLLGDVCGPPPRWGSYCRGRFSRGFHPEARCKDVFLGATLAVQARVPAPTVAAAAALLRTPRGGGCA